MAEQVKDPGLLEKLNTLAAGNVKETGSGLLPRARAASASVPGARRVSDPKLLDKLNNMAGAAAGQQADPSMLDSAWEGIKSAYDATVVFMKGDSRREFDLPELGSAKGGTALQDLRMAAGYLVSAEPQQVADIAVKTLPGATQSKDKFGTGNGGLSSSLSALANNTWYHVFAIIVGGVADVGADTSVTAANLVSDHGATAYRRIGSILTDGSANILAFVQYGNEFIWVDPILDSSAAATSSAALVALSVPSGINVRANINVRATYGSASFLLYISSPDADNEAPATTSAPLASLGVAAGGATSSEIDGTMAIRTNTSRQIRQRANQNLAGTWIVTTGWTDDRGRND